MPDAPTPIAQESTSIRQRSSIATGDPEAVQHGGAGHRRRCAIDHHHMLAVDALDVARVVVDAIVEGVGIVVLDIAGELLLISQFVQVVGRR